MYFVAYNPLTLVCLSPKLFRMQGRPHPLITGNIYHIYNKTIEKRRVFIEPKRNGFCFIMDKFNEKKSD